MRDRILKTATRLYTHYGIKSVSMNQIAAELRISKRTLYEHFRDKNELVLECVRSETGDFRSQLVNTVSPMDSPLENILHINQVTLQQMLPHCPAFFRDLEYFPEVEPQIHSLYPSFIETLYRRQLSRGKKEGTFLPDINIGMIVDLFQIQIRTTVEKYWKGEINSSEAYSCAILTFLAGICTDKGRVELHAHKSSDFFKIKSSF